MEQNGKSTNSGPIPTGPLLKTFFEPERTIDLGPYRRQYIVYDSEKTRVLGSAPTVEEYLALMEDLDRQNVRFVAAGIVPDEFFFRV